VSSTFANTGDVWKPRFRVFIGAQGVYAPGTAADQDVSSIALSAMVQKQNWYQADRHKVVLSLWGNEQFGYEFWSGFQTMSILVDIGFEINGSINYTEVFRGYTDKVVIDAVKGTVTLTGRNALGFLTDFKEVNFFPEQTIGEILTTVITETGLPAPDLSGIGNVADQTYGRYWPSDGTKNTGTPGQNATLNPMDVVTAICQQYGIYFYEQQGQIFFTLEQVQGDTGFMAFAPQPTYQLPGVTKLSPSNCTSLTFEHDLNISQWNWYMQATNYDAKGMALGNGAQYPPENVGADHAKAFHLQSANKTADDNLTYAQSAYTEFTLHEWIVVAKVAGPQILGLMLNNLIEVQGTGTIMDGDYMIDSIEHQIDFNRGYIGTVKGRWGAGAAGQTGQGASGP
jgi:hypothetical protein